MKQTAVAILAGLLTAQPFEAITATANKIQQLTHEQHSEKEVFQQLEALTASVEQVNNLLESQIDAINGQALQQLKTVNVILSLSFELLKKTFDESLFYSTYNRQARAFSAQKFRLKQLTQQAKERLEGVKTFTGLMTAEQLAGLNEAVDRRWQNAFS